MHGRPLAIVASTLPLSQLVLANARNPWVKFLLVLHLMSFQPSAISKVNGQ